MVTAAQQVTVFVVTHAEFNNKMLEVLSSKSTLQPTLQEHTESIKQGIYTDQLSQPHLQMGITPAVSKMLMSKFPTPQQV